MQGEYIGRYSRNSAPRRDSALKLIAKGVVALISVALAIAMVICYLTPYISPDSMGSLTIVGIFAPIIYLGVLIMMLITIIIKRWVFAATLFAVAIIGIPHISKYYNIDFMRETEKPTDRSSFTMMSYNVRGFYNDDGERVVDEFVVYLSGRELPEILCLQEFSRDAEGVDLIDTLYRHTFGNYYTYESIEAGNVVLKTYSRYPFVKDSQGEIAGQNSGTSQWVDVVIKEKDTVRIFNNHLYTMSITEEDSEDIARGEILQDGDRVRSIVQRIADNSSIRAKHAEMLHKIIKETPYRHIVCGDFNDTPLSYVYNTLSEELDDAFVEAGSGPGCTFRPMHHVLRIDYILFSGGLEIQSYDSDHSATMSDHLPVEARFKAQTK